MNGLEDQKRQLQALMYDAQEKEAKEAVIEAELASFELWMESRRVLLDDSFYIPSWEEKRRAIRSPGITCRVYPATGDWPFRRTFDLAPPEIMKLIHSAGDFTISNAQSVLFTYTR